MVAVALVALAYPVTRSAIGAERETSAPVAVVSEGFSATLNAQAGTLVMALTQGNSMGGDARTAALSGEPGGVPLVPRPLLVTAARVLVQGALAGPEGKPALAPLRQPVDLTIHEGQLSWPVFSTRATVGEAMTALGMSYNDYDRVSPAPDTLLTPGLHVYIDRATRVLVSVGGNEASPAYTHVDTVRDLLAERNIAVADTDAVEPGLATSLVRGMQVTVTKIANETLAEDAPLPFYTIYRDDPELAEGTIVVAQAGVNGYVHREYALVYRNGEEISRELVSEFTVPPTSRIIVQGTYVPTPEPAPAPLVTSDPSCPRKISVWATWYTAASAGGSGRTATGTIVRKGTVAVDPRVIPLGTEMYIPGYGYGRAEDTGGGIVGYMIDLGFGASDPKTWRNGYVNICILN